MWDFFQTVRRRHSIRKYQTDMPVEDSHLHAVLEAACAAPSAGDLQAYRIIVVRDAALREALSAAADGQAFVAEAPVCLVFCTEPQRSAVQYGERGASLYALQDATIATAYAELGTVAAGLGSTWVGRFNEARVRELLELEPGSQPVALLSLGYPAELPQESRRRRLDELVSYR
jgi:nitroreductase